MKILRPEVESCLVNSGGVYDMFDNVVKVLFNITDEEYDYIAEHSTDDELDIFVTSLGTLEKGSSFGERRKALELRNSMLSRLENQKK